MINDIIKSHIELIPVNKYEFLDPDIKHNNLRGLKLTQEEIITYIKLNNINKIEIKYYDKYILKYNINNKQSSIYIDSIEPNSIHLIRLISLKKIPNYSFKMGIEVFKSNGLSLNNVLFELNNLLDEKNKTSIMDYCTVCGVELKLKGLDKIACCSSSTCSTTSRHIVMDNRITDMYKKDPYLCEILIDLLIKGSAHPKGEKIFKPLPVIKKINNLVQLNELLKSEANNLTIDKIAKCSNDVELNNLIGSNAYAIISNAISDNYFSLSTIETFQTEYLNDGKYRLEKEGDENVFDSENVRFIGLNYSYEIESKFKKQYFLFHGTPIYSWYPIVKNGLKVMSGTEFMANGAAYGNGIYLSNEFNMSLGYSTKYNSSRMIIGVFEIADEIKKYLKSTSIYVVNDDKIMLLRYLIVVEKSLTCTQTKEISDYFTKYLGFINKSNDKKSVNIKNKRFNAELKLLNDNKNVLNVEIIEETSNWKIELNKIKDKKVYLNVFFNDYPKLPPKISLESELNSDVIKNICDNNSNIFIPEINPSKWEVTTNLSKIINIVHNCLVNS